MSTGASGFEDTGALTGRRTCKGQVHRHGRKNDYDGKAKHLWTSPGQPIARRWYALNLLEELSKPGILHRPQNAIAVLLVARQLSMARESPSTPSEDSSSTSTTPPISSGKASCWKKATRESVSTNPKTSPSRMRSPKHAQQRHCSLWRQNNKIHLLRHPRHGTGGVVIGGGNKNTRTGNSLVENCHIWKFSVHKLTYSNGITLSGVGNAARHNEIHGAPHMAIGMGANDCIFEYKRRSPCLPGG